MKPDYQKIYQLAEPYLSTRFNDVHTAISIQCACKLLAVEGGNETIVLPAVILHDVGWKKVPEQLHLKAFGPKANSPQLNRLHEVEGVNIARNILKQVNYPEEKISEIIEIIKGHDSRQAALSRNDRIVKDADKLWRYSKQGFKIDIERFEESYAQGLNRLRRNLAGWFFTETGKKLARKELRKREKEAEL
jgi:HD superfamily phosphodiesterase